MLTMTQEEFNKKPADYRGVIDGKPYLLHMNKEGQTVYSFVNIAPIITLTCCCCTSDCKGRQWYNRDQDFGLCPTCAKWIATRETPEQMLSNYGQPNINYFTEEK
jgi:hypothetical protein